MASLERWETLTQGPVRKGARYTVHWKIGSVPIGGVVEVSEFDQARDLAWIGISGVSLRGRFRVRDNGDGHTKVIFRLAYQSAGSPLRLVADPGGARKGRRNKTQTPENPKKKVG